VHSADGWEEVLKPVLARYSAEARPSITRRYLRGDAAFAIPALFELMEAEGWGYAIRIKGNSKLHERNCSGGWQEAAHSRNAVPRDEGPDGIDSGVCVESGGAGERTVARMNAGAPI
ncbi:MAG: transposase, partial [Rhodobacteraceae bacterium]|nr:transposase [Paracoccaceae bacterium]